MAPLQKPIPLSPYRLEIIKKSYGLSTDEEACQPSVLRELYEKTSTGQSDEVVKEDRMIEMNNIKVKISIIRPVGSEDKELPVILFL
jgi:hypothetical protein